MYIFGNLQFIKHSEESKRCIHIRGFSFSKRWNHSPLVNLKNQFLKLK